MNQTKRQRDLSASRSRARIALKNNQTEELEKLLAALELHPSVEDALPYRRLVEGHLAELSGDLQAALEAYLTIIDLQQQDLMEDTLMRVAHISLETNNAANALSALQCLAQLSPVHQPQYAEMLRLMDDPLGAIDVYHEFLTRFPNNTYVQFKLARLYLDINAHESARMLLQYILVKEPGNETAQKMLASVAASP